VAGFCGEAEVVPTINDWHFDFKQATIVGKVTGYRGRPGELDVSMSHTVAELDLPEGELDISTSRVVAVEPQTGGGGECFTTQSGSRYKLGTVEPAFAEQLSGFGLLPQAGGGAGAGGGGGLLQTLLAHVHAGQ
jgi:hypothetical protein